MKRKYSVCSNDELRNLCIRYGWFTDGSCEQYKKMFEINEKQMPLREIAVAIWICSHGYSLEQVEEKLEEKSEDYLMELGEAQIAEGERAADEIYCSQFG